MTARYLYWEDARPRKADSSLAPSLWPSPLLPPTSYPGDCSKEQLKMPTISSPGLLTMYFPKRWWMNSVVAKNKIHVEVHDP
jgi:hypothetical protein